MYLYNSLAETFNYQMNIYVNTKKKKLNWACAMNDLPRERKF